MNRRQARGIGLALLCAQLWTCGGDNGVGPPPATQLVFKSGPANTVAGASIAPAVQVEARDASGNAVAGFSGSVTVALGTNPAGGTLSGTKTATAASGVATFANLSIDKAATGYTLSATGAGLSGATSAAFNVTPGPASKLVFTTQPASTPAGTAITAVTVTAQDALGNTATAFAGSVTVAITTGTGTGGAALSGTTTATATAGLVTFTTLSVDKSGTGYTLSASATGLTTGTSTPFTISAGTAVQFAFTVQPTTATAGTTIAPAVSVTAQDALGNTVTTFTAAVTVAITPGTGTVGAVLSGAAPVPAVAGVATFAALSIDKSGTASNGTGYTLSATSPGLTGATSEPFDVLTGAASRLAFTLPPTTTAAGAHIGPVVEVTVLDAAGNRVTTFGGTVNVAITAGTGTAGAVLSGQSTVTAAAGVATFLSLSIDKVGTGYTLAAASGGLSPDTTTAFAITPGPATQLAFSGQPTNATAGGTISPAVQVTVLDAHGNTATNFAANVTVAIGVNPGSGTLLGITTLAAVSGVATFSNLRINNPGTGYRLVTFASAVTTDTSAAFNVVPSTPTHLLVTVQPSAATAGAAIAPAVAVTVRDASNQTVTSFAGNVTIAITPGTGTAGATLSGTTTVAAVAGVATFPGLNIDKAGTAYALSATSGVLTGATSAAFDITPGAAAVLVFTVQPSAATAGAVIMPQVEVTARDAQGNVATGFSGNVTVAIGTNPAGGTLSGAQTVAAAGGVASFATLRIDNAGTGYTLTATAAGPTGATSAGFDILPGIPTQLAFAVQPTGATAGASITPAIQVSARDASGQTATGFTGLVALTITSGTGTAGATLAGSTTIAAVAGVATFPGLSIDKSGTSYTLTATAAGGGLAGAVSAAFDITPGTATQLVFTSQPSPTAAGATITPAIQVSARDALGNTATGFTGNVTVAIGTNPAGGTLSGNTIVTASAGVALFASLSINNAGTGYTLTATATGPAGGTSAAFDITVGPPNKLAFTVQPASATAGATITPAVQVTAQDALGNTLPGFTSAISLAITTGTGTAGATLLGTTTVAATLGVATFSTLNIDKAGTGYTLTASTAGLTSATSSALAITPGAAAQLVFSVQPVTTSAASTLSPAVLVTALDAHGNTATGFTGSVTVAIGTNPGGGSLSGETTADAVAGVATFATLSIDNTGNGYTLTASATGPAGATSSPFDIIPGVATHLAFSTQPTDATAGATISPAVQVTARDAAGQTATGFTGDVTLTITGGTGTSGAALSGTTTAAAVAGVATFADLSIDKSGTGYTLSVTSAGLSGSTSGALDVTPGAAAQLVFTGHPSDAAAGATISPDVQLTAHDDHGNPVPSFTGNVTVSIGANPGGGTLSGITMVVAVAGVASFSGLAIDRSGTGYTLTAASAGLAGATSNPFTIGAAAATQLVFTVQPSNATAGVTLAPAIEVTAVDAQGNVATTFSGTVNVALGANPGSGTLSGSTSLSAVAGVASFSGLAIDKTGVGYTLTASSGGLTGTTSAGFAITPGPAVALFFTVQPSLANEGSAISPAVRVTARDALGNSATSFQGNVTIAIGTNPGGGTLFGTQTQAAISGVATFSALNINNAGTGYTLTGSSGGLTQAVSTPFDIAISTATQLFFSLQPGNTTAGAAIAPTIEVQARDVSGHTVAGFAGDVTLSITSGTGAAGAALSGTTTVSAGSGIAAFSDLSIDKAAVGYKLTAMASGLPATTSAFFTITPGTADQLVFTLQPSTTTMATTITPRVEVTARDALGNVATGFSENVTVAIGTNPAGGTLSGTKTVAAANGVASFATLSIDNAGTGYTLAASAAGPAGTVSAPFDVTAIRATQLVFTVQPSVATAGLPMLPAVQVTARDASGQTATGFTGAVTLTITAGTGTLGATLSGSTTVAAVDGVATFSTLIIDRSGSGFKLSATGAGVSGSVSTAFTINPGAPARVTFTVHPASTTAGETIQGATGPAVQATVRDALGNPVKVFSGDVSLALAVNPGGGVVGGSSTVAAVNGVATFSDISIDRSGIGYRMVVVSSGLAPDTSVAFSISGGTATQLRFTVQPGTTNAGASISPAIRVAALDSLGNVATSFIGDVTLVIDTNPSGGVLSGVTTQSVASGVAFFSGLSINQPGAGYTLRAAATGLTSATSVAFNIN